MHALPNFFHNRVSQIAFINDEQTLFSPYTVPMPRSWVCTTEGFPRNRYQRHESNGTEAGNWTWALLCWSPHLSDLHNSFTATCPLLPPSAGNNFTLPRLRSSSSQASITRSSIATMLQLRAEAIPNLRAQHSQLPSQPGPSRIQEGKDHPTKGNSFSTTGTLGLGPLRGNLSPPILSQAGSGTSQRKHGRCVFKERPRGSDSSFMRLLVIQMLFLNKKILF